MKWQMILIALAVAVGGYFIFNKSDDDTATNSSETTQSQSSKELSSINKLIERGGNIQCSFDHTDESGTRNTGMAYFSDGRMFGDFSATQADGKTLQSNVLSMGDTQYVWDASTKDGYKLNTSALDKDNDDDTEAQTSNQDDEYEFGCIPWSVDESQFDIPGDVNFVDNTAIINNVETNLQNISEVCAQLTDPAQREACEQAVGL